jgi:hypothetical protein
MELFILLLAIFFGIAVFGHLEKSLILCTVGFIGIAFIGILNFLATYQKSTTVDYSSLKKAGCERVGFDRGKPYFRCPNSNDVIFAHEFIQPEAE